MDRAFPQGVRPGSVTQSHEVSILICYLMDRVGGAVTYELLSQTLMSQQLVNYFEFTSAMSSLTKSGHILREEGGGWILTPLGRSAAQTFEGNLPAAVRERAVGTMEKLLILLRRQQENQVLISKAEDGYTVTLTITDIGSDLLRVSIFMPTLEECEAIRRRFLNDPTFTYRGVFAILTGDMETAGELLPSKENLFDE